eukprot:11227891-Lingulodinium_polyedra.AAC.1
MADVAFLPIVLAGQTETWGQIKAIAAHTRDQNCFEAAKGLCVMANASDQVSKLFFQQAFSDLQGKTAALTAGILEGYTMNQAKALDTLKRFKHEIEYVVQKLKDIKTDYSMSEEAEQRWNAAFTYIHDNIINDLSEQALKEMQAESAGMDTAFPSDWKQILTSRNAAEIKSKLFTL